MCQGAPVLNALVVRLANLSALDILDSLTCTLVFAENETHIGVAIDISTFSKATQCH